MWTISDLTLATIFCVIIGGILAQAGLIMVAGALGIVAIITLAAAMLKYLNRT